jgi:serine protease Do
MMWTASPVMLLAQEKSAQLRQLLESKAAGIVTVRAVIKTELTIGGRTRDRESRLERRGVMVDANGLVMTDRTSLAPEEDEGGDADFSQKTTPLDIKVVVEREEQEFAAAVVATDAKSGLAFLRIKDLGDRKLAALDLSQAAKVEIGDEVAVVERMGKGYDFAPYFRLGRITGSIDKPRKAWIYAGNLGSEGTVVFTPGGQLAGVITTVESGLKGEEEDAGIPAGLGGLLGRIRSGQQGDSFIVPAGSIAGLIDQAKKRAAEQASEEASRKEGEGKGDKDGK